MKYKKKPVVVEAVQWTGNNFYDIVRFVDREGVAHSLGEDTLYIPTFKGIMSVNKGDYIIKGTYGGLYHCESDIFKDTYEEVDEL